MLSHQRLQRRLCHALWRPFFSRSKVTVTSVRAVSEASDAAYKMCMLELEKRNVDPVACVVVVNNMGEIPAAALASGVPTIGINLKESIASRRRFQYVQVNALHDDGEDPVMPLELEAFATASFDSLPPLRDYSAVLRKDATQFFLLTQPDFFAPDFADRVQGILPNSHVACGSAYAPRVFKSIFTNQAASSQATAYGFALHERVTSSAFIPIARKLLGHTCMYGRGAALFLDDISSDVAFRSEKVVPGKCKAMKKKDILQATSCPEELPLFILDTVMVPGSMKQVYVFEPRYREIVQNYFEKHQLFAVATPPHFRLESRADEGLIDLTPRHKTLNVEGSDRSSNSPSSSATGGPQEEVATVVRIAEVERVEKGGRCLLVLEGVRRCVFNRASVHGDSYGVVKARNAQYIDDCTGETENAEAKLLARKIRATLEGDSQEHELFRRLWRSWCPSTYGPPEHLSPQLLSWWLCDVLPVPDLVRRSWLALTETRERLKKQLAFMEAKVNDLRFH